MSLYAIYQNFKRVFSEFRKDNHPQGNLDDVILLDEYLRRVPVVLLDGKVVPYLICAIETPVSEDKQDLDGDIGPS